MAGENVPIKVGNSMPLSQIPLGTSIHCVEMKPKKGAQIARSAGAYAQLVAKDGPYALLRLRSGQMRKVPQECSATIGEVSNPEHNLAKIFIFIRTPNNFLNYCLRGTNIKPNSFPPLHATNILFL